MYKLESTVQYGIDYFSFARTREMFSIVLNPGSKAIAITKVKLQQMISTFLYLLRNVVDHKGLFYNQGKLERIA